MNPDEMVDALDENFNVVESVTKREAHEKGLLHACVISEILDSKGRWLLVKQANDRQDAGQYVSPVGGHVQSGESYEDALRREAAEEVGFTSDFKFEHLSNAAFERHVIGRHENHLFVMYKIFSDQEPVLNHESDSCRYFTEEELREELKSHPERFGAAMYFVIDQCFSHLKS